MAPAEKHPHALVVPASGQGHINPCMRLAKSLASLGFRVSFVYFSSEYAKLQAKQRLQHLEQEDAHPSVHIHVVEDAVAPADSHKLFFSTPVMIENLFNLILDLLREQGTPLTCLIADTFAPWTVHVAERAGIPFINFWTSNAMAYLLCYALSPLFSQAIFPEKGSPTQWKRKTPLMLDPIPGLPPFSSELYPADVRFADASDPFVCLLKEVASCGQQGERMLIHTMAEMEPVAFHALQALGIPACAIGSLLQSDKKRQEGSIASSQATENLSRLSTSQLINEQCDCMAWLNMQVESSVIYVAFGSHAPISVTDIQELAYGLEASENPFLWVIREDLLGGAELSQVLSNAFLHRIRQKGMIISWAPQVEVLAHNAIGGFLSHCGWNSTMESLCEGVPMLCCPCFAEQLSNSHYLCDVWGVGLELARTNTGGIERKDVEAGVKGLMREEEGLKARRKAQEVMQLVRKTCQPGGQSFNNLQKFYEDMKEISS